MKDYLVKAYAFDGTVRIYAAKTTNLVDKARKIHGTWPAASAAFGRVLTASLIMGAMYKGDQTLTIRINGGGPIGEMVAITNAHGTIKGTVENPEVHFSKKDLKIRDIFTSSARLQTGEIADDFTYYFASSEQIPTSVALGVLVNENNEVFASGGFILQLMPGTTEETIQIIEKRIKEMKPISELLSSGKNPEDIINIITEGNHKFIDEMPLDYVCDCSKKRFEKGLISLGKEEINNFIKENKPIEITCQFCKKQYNFSISELKTIYKNL